LVLGARTQIGGDPRFRDRLDHRPSVDWP
jgi:hypothetical protein